MPYFTWQREFETGVAAVDQQHKNLVEMVNRLHDAVEDGLDNNAIQDTLNRLVDYTRIHFADEEALMARVDDLDTTAHIRQHQAFINELTDMMIKYGETGALTGEQLTAFLKGWLQEHFLHDDKEMIQAYTDQQKASTQEA